jgi:protein N-terminal glutamine amidohydrolase
MVPYLHQPFWCEENIWHLAQHPAVADTERLVLVIVGATAEVACWHQKAGPDRGPVLWDYHVVLATRAEAWHIWDLDGRLGYPVSAESWLRTTFPRPDLVPARHQPRFAVFPAEDYVRRFGSDRAHMRAANGTWLRPPPPWDVLAGQGLTLAGVLGEARRGLDLTALRERLR